jgi:hypothetical protein
MTLKGSSQTTINSTEYKPGLNVLPFAPKLADFITNSLKLTTYRFGDKYSHLNIGDVVSIQNSVTKKSTLKARVKSISRSKFIELPLDDGGHEAYENKEHQRKVFSGYYKYIGRKIKDDDNFLTLSFELVQDQ